MALMYNSYLFKKLDSRKVKLDLSEYDDTSRDILMVKFKAKLAEKTTIYVLVNHWPSRREGKATSEPKRVKAAKTLDGIRDDILKEEPNAHIVIMGDFNDEPFDKSIKETLATTVELDQVSQEKFYNPMGRLKQAGLGSYNFRGNWNMLDQIMVSGSLMDGAGLDYEMHSANIYSPEWLRQHGGKYEGYPLRTFGGRKYLNGYSDHFPVSIRLKYASN